MTAVAAFRKVNLFNLPFTVGPTHGGHGDVASATVALGDEVAAACHHINYVEMPPASSVGDHDHREDSEEYYLILSGSGQMRLGDEVIDVIAGDLIRNDPGQTHGLTNTGSETLGFFVFNARTG